jgi:hypothetical protein
LNEEEDFAEGSAVLEVEVLTKVILQIGFIFLVCFYAGYKVISKELAVSFELKYHRVNNILLFLREKWSCLCLSISILSFESSKLKWK